MGMGRVVGADPTQYSQGSRRLSALTHTRSSPCAHMEAVASVAVTIIGAPSVHTDASPGATRLRLAFIHIWKDW